MSFRSKNVSLRVILDHIEGINLGILWSKMGIDFTFLRVYNVCKNKHKNSVEICLTILI